MRRLVLLRELRHVPTWRHQVECRQVVALILIDNEEVAHSWARFAVRGRAEGGNFQLAAADRLVRRGKERECVTIRILPEYIAVGAVDAFGIGETAAGLSPEREVIGIESKPEGHDGSGG